MVHEIRPLVAEDAPASQKLRREAFGVPSTKPRKKPTIEFEGRTWLGAFDGDRLDAVMVGLEHEGSFGGAFVDSVGIGSVTVANEHRRSGLLRQLFFRLLTDARAHGIGVSTLYPSASGIYRGLGYEVITDTGTVVVPTESLTRVPHPPNVSLRRAGEDDVAAITALYHDWALEQNGPLSRRGPLFESTPKKWLKRFTAVSLAHDAETGELVGYAAWNRGGWEGQQIEVEQFHWRSAAGAQALLSMLGSNTPVADQVRFQTSGQDPLRLLLPSSRWRVQSRMPYMLKVVDLRTALQARHWPEGVELELPFRIVGDLLEANNGDWKLRIEDGQPLVTRIGREGAHSKRAIPLELTPRGLAAVYGGAQSVATLRTVGLVSGGDPTRDAAWSIAFGGRQVHIRDFF